MPVGLQRNLIEMPVGLQRNLIRLNRNNKILPIY
jgi:hypothetical protein